MIGGHGNRMAAVVRLGSAHAAVLGDSRDDTVVVSPCGGSTVAFDDEDRSATVVCPGITDALINSDSGGGTAVVCRGKSNTPILGDRASTASMVGPCSGDTLASDHGHAGTLSIVPIFGATAREALQPGRGAQPERGMKEDRQEPYDRNQTHGPAPNRHVDYPAIRKSRRSAVPMLVCAAALIIPLFTPEYFGTY